MKSASRFLKSRGRAYDACNAGQVLFVPRRWAHAVLNLQDSVGVAKSQLATRRSSEWAHPTLQLCMAM